MASNIVELARTILAQAEHIDASLKAAGQPDLSLGIGGGHIPNTDAAAQAAKQSAKSAMQQLLALLNGPFGLIQDLATAEWDLAAIQVIQRFQIANSFPANGTTTYDSIAKSCGIPENRARTILRFAMTSGIFAEIRTGVIAHTAISQALADDFVVRAAAAQMADEQFPAAAHLAESIEMFGDSEEGVEAGWAIANRASQSMFAELEHSHPKRARQFGRFMDFWATQHSTRPLIELIDWSSITAASRHSKPHLVDIGGGKGHVCAALAQALPDFMFTVQDYPRVIANAQSTLPSTIRDRITYQAHDFISDVQPVYGADVYYFRSIFHDWPDKYCVQILRNLIPALKPGSRIILNELCLTSQPLPPPIERMVRAMDMVMLSLLNGQERSKEDFKRIFSQADPRFHLVAVKEPALNSQGVPEEGLLSIVQFVWTGDRNEQ